MRWTFVLGIGNVVLLATGTQDFVRCNRSLADHALEQQLRLSSIEFAPAADVTLRQATPVGRLGPAVVPHRILPRRGVSNGLDDVVHRRPTAPLWREVNLYGPKISVQNQPLSVGRILDLGTGMAMTSLDGRGIHLFVVCNVWFPQES